MDQNISQIKQVVLLEISNTNLFHMGLPHSSVTIGEFWLIGRGGYKFFMTEMKAKFCLVRASAYACR